MAGHHLPELGRDWARRATTRLEVTSDTLADHPDGTDVAAEAIHRVQRTQVERALWALPEPQRMAVTLMDLGGFTAAEVAAMLGSPRGRCWPGRTAAARRWPERSTNSRRTAVRHDPQRTAAAYHRFSDHREATGNSPCGPSSVAS